MKAELIPKNGDPPIPIKRDLTVVGRREYCDVQIDFHGISKRHCVLVKTDGLLVIRDLATTNGTKVNGQRVRWAALLPNDRLTIGGYKTSVYLGPDDVPSPSEMAGRGDITPRQPPTAQARAPVPVAKPAKKAAKPAKELPADEGFASPSPLGTPLLSRDDLRDAEPSPDETEWPDAPTRQKNGEPFIIELD
jgi:pSer/pThr/pTyr-binding forkhead associated (FHA) protein